MTTQPRTLPQVKRKRRRYNKKRGRRQTRKNTTLNDYADYVIQTMTAQPTDGPKLYSIAGSTIATFSEAHVAAMRWKNEVRPRITAEIDGQKIDLLYDTGAQTSCLTKDTVRQMFPTKKLQTASSECRAAGNVNLGVVGEAQFVVKVKGRTLTQEFIVCTKINDNIMGIDLANALELSYDAGTRRLFSIAPIDNSLVVHRRVLLPASSTTVLPAKFNGDWDNTATYVATIYNPRTQFVVGGPALVRITEDKTCLVAVINTAPHEIYLERGDFLGAVEALEPHLTEVLPVETLPVASIFSSAAAPRNAALEPLLHQALDQTPGEHRSPIEELLRRHAGLLQINPNSQRRLPQDPQRVHHPEPVYRKQTKIPQAHLPVIEETLEQWIRLGLVRKADSMFNTPLFCLRHADGYRVVQDFRLLNKQRAQESIKFKETYETLAQIEKEQPQFFSTVDLSGLAWQMTLNQEQATTTAFTLPGQGQFQWTQTPLGILGAEASFHRLLSAIFGQLPGLLVHIDKLVLFNQTWEQHLQNLEQVFTLLERHQLKVNPGKTRLGTNDASIMGFHIEYGLIKMDPTQLGNAHHWAMPEDVKTIRSFLGLCNFFRGHIKDYATLSAPLNRLLRKDSAYSGGPMPSEAQEAFTRLKRILCSQPVLALPSPDKQYALIVDASTGAKDFEGGLGAILTQLDAHGRFSVIAYASRLLQGDEKNFSPFLLEMRAMVWATRYFQDQLRGQQFILFTDHKPLATCAEAQGKSLTELQLLSLEFNFVIQHKKGINMPADFLSRSGLELEIHAINFTPTSMADYQNRDPEIRALIEFRATGRWPNYLNRHVRSSMQQKESCFTTDIHRRFWVRTNARKQVRNLLYAPHCLRSDILQEAHGYCLAGHSAIERTLERITTSWWWPSLRSDVTKHIQRCSGCQRTRKSDTKPAPLAPLPIPTEPNQRVHVDLYGPLKSSGFNKHVLCMTDAFSKIAVVVPIPDKEASTVAQMILDRWVYRFAPPVQIHSDGGKEFVNKLSAELFAILDIKHTKTTPAHPQCNAQVENFNRRIKDYLSPYLHDHTLDWEKFLPAMEFAYNTSYQSTIGTTPFQLMHGFPADSTGFQPKAQPSSKHLFIDNKARLTNLAHQRPAAVRHSEVQKDQQKRAFDKHAQIHKFSLNQNVLVRVHDFLNKNRKLATKFEGPYQIVELYDNYAILSGKNGKRIKRNILHLKPFFAPTVPPPSLAWSDTVNQGEGSDVVQTFGNMDNSDAEMATLITSVLCEEASTHEKTINQKLINQINEDLRPHLLEVALKILINQDLDFDPLTSEERKFWDSFSLWERSVILTGDPTGIPEWRTQLVAMPGQLPAAPAPPGPAAVQVPAPPPPPPPAPNPAPPVPSTSGRTNRTRRPDPPPSTRTLRSQGPAPFGLLPEKTKPRRKASAAPPAPENSRPPVAQAPTDASSLTQKLWTAGWNTFGRLLPGAANDDEPADLNNIDAVPPISGESSDSEDILSFF